MSPPSRSRRWILSAVGKPAASPVSGVKQSESAVGALAVVVRGVDAQHRLEVAAAEDEQPVETLGADGADKALGVGVSLVVPGSGCGSV
jgi:hypothetical protein